MFLLGRTQSRKSTLAALALSFFGKFTASTLPSSFKDTANAIEKKGYLLKDMLTMVDDYHSVSDSYIRKNMEQIMQSIVRGYGDRTGRDRMNTDIKLRGGYAPRGNIIVTGEDFPNIGQSGTARSFIVELMPNDVHISDYLNKAQHYAAEGYFTDFMREYIEWLIPQTDELPKKLKQKFLDYRRDALDGNFSGLGRTGDNVAWLMIGFEYFSKFLCYSHIISEEEQKLFLQQAWEVFTNLALKQIEKSVEETPTQMFVSAIHDLFETQKISTQSIGGFPESLSEKVGYHDSDYYYFIPSKIYAEVEKYFLQQGEIFPLSKNRIMRQLSIEKITVTDSGANTIQKRLYKGRGKYLCFPKSVIDGEVK